MINSRLLTNITSVVAITTCSLWAHSPNTSVYPAQNSPSTQAVSETQTIKASEVSSQRSFIGNANTTTDITKLQSRPGMPFVIYLHFDESRNPSEELKRTIWEQISDDWILFRANVTTDVSVFDATPLNKRAKCVFTTYFANGGGSRDEVTGERSATINLKMNHVPESGGDFLFRTPSHELGHTFEVVHDICTSPWSNYYSGHGEWSTIMGSSNSRAVSHWSKGEYRGAGNSQDDIAIIGDSLGFVDDDKPDPVELVIETNGDILPGNNNGTITAQDDIDVFTLFLEEGATLNINGDPSILYPNLDMGLTLKDPNGEIIANDEPVGLRTASINTTVSAAGTYTLEVDGVGELTPSDGWSDYSSMGYYQLNGSIDGGVVHTELEQKRIDKSFVIKHNSATNIVEIQGATDYRSIQLISINGSVIRSFDNTNAIDVSSVSPGVYILALKNGNTLSKSQLLTIQ